MKINVYLKDPDALHEAIREARRKGSDVDEPQINRIAAKWFKYGEYLTVELDTETETCVLVPR